MSDNYSPAYLVFAPDVGFFHKTARDYKRDALIIKNDKYNACSPAFHMLSSISFELFPKVLIALDVCLKYKNNHTVSSQDIILEIGGEIKKYGHNIERLLKKFPDLMTTLDIKSISYFSNYFVSEYRIETSTQSYIPIKSLDGIRYGSFATSRDIMTSCMNDQDIIDLLNGLEDYVAKKYQETNTELQKYFN